jgi:hypothetical protein
MPSFTAGRSMQVCTSRIGMRFENWSRVWTLDLLRTFTDYHSKIDKDAPKSAVKTSETGHLT